VQLKRQHLITRAGNLFCAGSINSVADLTGYFIERFYGTQVARQVEGHFSPEIRRSYRQQGYVAGEANMHHDELMIDAQHWLQTHAADPVDFGQLAQQFSMSQRTLNRRFKLATGMSPGRYAIATYRLRKSPPPSATRISATFPPCFANTWRNPPQPIANPYAASYFPCLRRPSRKMGRTERADRALQIFALATN
jgi:hypothetical protein